MDIAERTSLLANYLDCSDASADALARLVQVQAYSARSYLSHQGDQIEHMWLLLEGTVQLQAVSAEGQATIISAFGPGELIGGHEGEYENAFDTRALTKVQTFQINALQLRDLLRSHPDLARGLSRIYSGQLMAVLDRLAARVTLSAIGRFYRELLRAAGPSDTISPPPVVAALALSAQTTRETGSRALGALERRGIIEREGDQLVIKSRTMLEELVL